MNTIKHAPSARASVAVRYGESEVEVSVADDGAGAADGAGAGLSGGQGLVGMRERVALYGGEFESGPRAGGGFQVCARFPLPDRVAA